MSDLTTAETSLGEERTLTLIVIGAFAAEALTNRLRCSPGWASDGLALGPGVRAGLGLAVLLATRCSCVTNTTTAETGLLTERAGCSTMVLGETTETWHVNAVN